MKKLFCFLTGLLFWGSLFAQEKFPVPERTCEQKHNMVMYQSWSMIHASINFAKSQGVSPYEYGKFVGGLFAPSWNPEGGFDAVVATMLNVWESFKTDADGDIVMNEMEDGSVSMDYPRKALEKYISGENSYTSMDEIVEYFQGVLKPIADYMGCTVNLKLTETSMVFTVKKIE